MRATIMCIHTQTDSEIKKEIRHYKNSRNINIKFLPPLYFFFLKNKRTKQTKGS